MKGEVGALRTVVSLLGADELCEGCSRDVPALDFDLSTRWCSTCRHVIPYVVYGRRPAVAA